MLLTMRLQYYPQLSRERKSSLTPTFLYRKSTRRSSAGFTIVELLIVIVVIGILAAITIVAYNGVVQKANNAKTIQAVSDYIKGLSVYTTQNSAYPVANWSCLGVPGTVCGNVTDTTTQPCAGGQALVITSFYNTMATVFNGQTPQPSTTSFDCGGKQYSGAWFNSPTGTTGEITYFLQGNQSCDGVGGYTFISRTQVTNGTACDITLPTP